MGAGASLAGWLRDRVPPTLVGRLRLGSGQLAAVALLVAVGLAVTAWWVLRSRPSVDPVASASVAPRPTALVPLSTSAPSPVGSSSSASPGMVVVDVAGKVRHPGIARLPAGARVVDALRAAGGVRRGVSLTALNLARVLVDGEQIVVGVRAAPGVAASAASVPGAGTSAPLVNLNTADESQLETLPDVGPVTAAAILKWRADNGSFSSVDQLLDISGIGDAIVHR